MMFRMMSLALLLAAAALPAGCVVVDAKAPRHIGPPPEEPPAQVITDPVAIERLSAENAQLRTQMNKLETDRVQWQAAVQSRQQEKDRLEDQRDALKKERDRAKDRFEDLNDD